MNEHEDSTLTSGRNWGAIPLRQGQYEWKMDPDDSLVQGPIKMEDLLGQRMLLNLELGQYGLLIRDGALKALYLDGCHHLDIGRREDQIQINSSLVFLNTEKSLHFHWTAQHGEGFVAPEGIPVIGRCSVRIEKPARFYQRVLRSLDDWSSETLRNYLDPLLHQAFSKLLAEICEPDCDHSGGLQSLLMGLGSHQLDEFITEHGLYCQDLAAYTAAPPIEEGVDQIAGQSVDLLHN